LKTIFLCISQAAETTLPNKVKWHTSKEKVNGALLTLYSDVLPHELLTYAEWVKGDAIVYYPTAVDMSLIDEAGHQTAGCSKCGLG